MCYSNVTLFYGLWVKTWSLAFAADAHDKIHPTLLAIDLLCLRRRKGELVAEGGEVKKTAVDLPVEVWKMVRQEVIDEALWDEEHASLKERRCRDCTRASGDPLDDYDVDDMSPYDPNKTVWKRWGPPTCEDCIVGVDFSEPFQWMDSAGRRKRTKRLLGIFRLRLALRITEKADYEELRDFDEASAISVPFSSASQLSTSSLKHPIASVEGVHDPPRPSSTVLDLSPDALALPSSADLRFHRLIRMWRLQVIDRSKTTLAGIAGTLIAHSQTGGSTEGARAEAEEEDEIAASQPRWMLWAYGESCG